MDVRTFFFIWLTVPIGTSTAAGPRPPLNLVVSNVTATSVRLSWSYEGAGGENISYYVVQYKPRQANRDYSETSDITTQFHHVHNLSPYTEYEFYVLAVNDLGRGTRSVPVTITTATAGGLGLWPLTSILSFLSTF